MSTRLATGGHLIDRRAQVEFSFNGKRFKGFAGDTLASALLANGQTLVGRSFKYHRPRGIMASGAEEPNALVNLGEGGKFEPNQRATTTELFDGLTARSQNHWPSLEFDIGVVNQLAARALPGGFYYKTFMYPRAFWKHVFERTGMSISMPLSMCWLWAVVSPVCERRGPPRGPGCLSWWSSRLPIGAGAHWSMGLVLRAHRLRAGSGMRFRSCRRQNLSSSGPGPWSRASMTTGT